MKLSRRKAIGAMVGGVAAAPTVAHELTHKLQDNLPQQYQSALIDETQHQANTIPLVDKIKNYYDRKSKLEKIINGELDEYQLKQLEKYIENYVGVGNNIDCLQSVSANAKKIMLLDKLLKQQKNNYIKSALNQLEHLLRWGEPT